MKKIRLIVEKTPSLIRSIIFYNGKKMLSTVVLDLDEMIYYISRRI